MNRRRSPWLVLIVLLVAPAAGAAEQRVLFADSFDKGLGPGWTWLREHPEHWRIRDGALEIRVVPGKADTVQNALVRTAPDRRTLRYRVEVTVTFNQTPVQQYEQGGITWYCQSKPALKLVHEQIDGSQWIIPGRKPAPHRTVRLRLTVEGDRWEAAFREEGQADFQPADAGKLPPPGEDQISLQCYDGPPEAEHWIRFDDFQIVELSEQP